MQFKRILCLVDFSAFSVSAYKCTEELDRPISDNQSKHLNLRKLMKLREPYEEIVGHAREAQTNLIVVTARGGDALDGAVFGSYVSGHSVRAEPGPRDPHAIDRP